MGAVRAIQVFNRQRAVKFDLPWLREAAARALALVEREGIARGSAFEALDEIEATIVSDREIARLHVQFMDIKGATDVLTFEHGEIIISAQTAARYAAEYGQTLEHELALYIIHGLLHLNGHDDLTEPEATRMKETQSRILREMLSDE